MQLTEKPPGQTTIITREVPRVPSELRGAMRAFMCAPATSRVLLLLGLIGVLLLGLIQLAPPRVVPATAPASRFSAERAMVDLRAIAAQPRFIGSPSNGAARQYFLETLTGMGLHPEVQTATGVTRFPGATTFNTGIVNNVVVRLPGTASTGAIVLDAHYDSTNVGPGAADNGAGVVAVLETLRTIQAGPPLKNDVIAVFADGEENGDLGAAAFMQEHPWAKDVRLALNFEAMGTGGPTSLYTTSAGNGWIMREAFAAAPHPFGSSFLPAIMSLEPGSGMDLDEYTSRGVPGFGFAFTNLDTAAYHTARDSVVNVDPRSIQHHGEWALSLTRHFGDLDLTNIPRERDATYFNLLPGVTVRYSQAWALPFALLVALLLVTVVTLGFRRRRLTVGGFLLGAIVFPVAVIVTTLLVVLAWWGIKARNPDYRVFMVGLYQALPYLLAFVLLTVALMTALYYVLLRRTRQADLAAGTLVLWAALMLLTAFAAPGIAFLFTWPLLGAIGVLAWLMFTRDAVARPWRYAVALALGAAPGLLLIGMLIVNPLTPVAYRFDVLTHLPLSPVPMVFVALLIGLLVPHLAFFAGARGNRMANNRHRWIIPGSAALAALVIISGANLTSGFDATHPRPDTIGYMLNADTGQARLVSIDPGTDAYTAQFFPAGVDRVYGTDFPPMEGMPYFGVTAPVVSLATPEATVLDDTAADGVRHLHLRLSSPRGAALLAVHVNTQGEISAATVDGRTLDVSALPVRDRRQLVFVYAALSPQGVDVTLTVASTAPVTVKLSDVSYGLPTLPGLTVAPRPTSTMPAPDMLDPTVVTASFTR